MNFCVVFISCSVLFDFERTKKILQIKEQLGQDDVFKE